MRRLFTLLLAAMLLCPIAKADGLLWRVSGADLARPSYIFGSYHLAPIEFVDSVPGLRQAIADADIIVGEMSRDELGDASLMQYMAPMITAPADSTLSKVLTPRELDSVDSIMAVYTGVPGMAMQFDAMKPAMLTYSLQIFKLMRMMGSLDAFDKAIMELPEAQGKPSMGLETAQQQFETLFGEPIADQAKTLVESVERDSEFTDISLRLLEAYLNRDLDTVTDMMLREECTNDAATIERLIYRRNRAWAEALPEMMREESLLVIVGAGHLGSDEGLLNLLRQKGYTVTEVR